MRFLSLLLWFLAGSAVAQTVSNPPPTFFPYSHVANTNQSSIGAWGPYQASVSTLGTTFNTIGTGRNSVQAMEIEGDPILVQVVLRNTTTSDWTLGQATISPTAQWGTGTAPGVDPIGPDGVRATAMLPVTFNSGGQNTSPWSPGLVRLTGTSTTSGKQVIPLSVNAIAGAQTPLVFASTVSSAITDKQQPAIGWYVTSGTTSGGVTCIAPGTKVTSVNITQIGISPSTAGACLANQVLYFSQQPLNLSITVPATANSPAPALVYSDWIPVGFVPRQDGGYVKGLSVSCTGCAGGSKVLLGVNEATSPNYNTITLDTNTTGVASGATVTFTATPTLTAQGLKNAGWLDVSDASLVSSGMFITGDAAIPANTYVVAVVGNRVRMSNILSANTGAIGTTITFTRTGFTSAATASGSPVLKFLSINNKRIMTMRSYGLTGNVVGFGTALANSNALNTFETATFNLPMHAEYQTGLTADGVNAVNTIQNGVNTTAFAGGIVAYLRYVTNQKGVTVCPYGDSHVAGGNTASGANTFIRMAANNISTLNRPVSYVDTGIGGQTPMIFGPLAAQWISNGTCSVIAAQFASRNDSFPFDQRYWANAIHNLALQAGGRVLYHTDIPRSGSLAWAYVVDTAVNNTTTVPLRREAFGSGFKAAGGSGYFLAHDSCPGATIPGGTTWSYAAGGQTFLTTSQNVTLPAGCVISFGLNMPATTSNGSTVVTLGFPSPITGTSNVGGTNITPGTILTVTQDSTTASLSQNASGNAGTLTVNNDTGNAFASEPSSGLLSGQAVSMATSSQPVVDTWFCGMDPNLPGEWIRGQSFDAVHANDDSDYSIANGLFPNCPSYTAALRKVVGN